MNEITENNLFTEASLSDSIIYKSFNANAEMTSLILSAIKNSIVIDSSYIEEQIIQIKRTRISPLADNVLKAFNEGHITLLYARQKKIPQALPFFATKMQGQIKVFIFVNNYGTISKETNGSENKYLNISMKDLYALMEGAYTAYSYAVYPIRVNKNLGLMKLCTSFYTTMMLRILNKEYTISMDQTLYVNVAFSIAKFFLKTVWMCENEDIINSYARSVINQAVNMAEIMRISEAYDDANIQDLGGLISFLKTFSPRLESMNLRYFMQMFINTYKASSIFGAECLPYFLFIIQSTLLGCFIINQQITADIAKNTKGMNTFYPELVKAIS